MWVVGLPRRLATASVPRYWTLAVEIDAGRSGPVGASVETAALSTWRLHGPTGTSECVSEVPVVFGGLSRTRTLDPLIKSPLTRAPRSNPPEPNPATGLGFALLDPG